MRGTVLDLAALLRSLSQRPAFVLAIALCLGIGIGAVTTFADAIDALYLMPPPGVARPDEIAIVAARSYPDFTDIRDGTRSFVGVAAFSFVDADLESGEGLLRARTLIATASYFPTLGLRPAIGRFFTGDDERMGRPPVAVLGFDTWIREFSRDPAVLGRIARIGGVSVTIVGVLPRGFAGLRNTPIDIVVPMGTIAPDLLHNESLLSNRHAYWLITCARLKPGVSIANASRDAFGATPGSPSGPSQRRDRQNGLVELNQSVRRRTATNGSSALIWLSSMAGIVLLAGCFNVVNLLFIRTVARKQEIVLRQALGASPLSALRLTILESSLLACVGGVSGVTIAMASSPIIKRMLESQQIYLQNPPVSHTLLVASAVSVIVAVLCGVQPSMLAMRMNRVTDVPSDRATLDASSSALRRALLVGEIAAMVALLNVAGIFVNSFRAIAKTEYGFELDHLIVGTPAMIEDSSVRASQSDERLRFAVERVLRLAQVRGAALASAAPLNSVALEPIFGDYNESVSRSIPARITAVDSNYVHTVGIALLAGRTFAAADVSGSAPVALVSRSFANRAWPMRPALGRCVRIAADTMPCRDVVGVVSNTRDDPESDGASPEVYVPLTQGSNFGPSYVIIRSRSQPSRVLAAIRKAFLNGGSGIGLSDLQPMPAALEPLLAPKRFAAFLFCALAAGSIILAIIGLGGAMSYEVATRRRELAIRVALGCAPSDLRKLIVAMAAKIALSGVVVGTLGSVLLRQYLASRLFGVAPLDSAILACAISLVVLVVAAASMIPSWRLSHVDAANTFRMS